MKRPPLDMSKSITVRTPAGPVRGVAADGVQVFKGIPFGMPTGGPARYRPPQPVAPWAEIFDATKPAGICPQDLHAFFPELPGIPTEECLQLNIWAPATPGPHPVLVWMHGGGNVQGSAGEPIYDGAIFAREDIVTVNFNYRLGAFGFLELGAVLGPKYRGSANNALRDQLLALQWVRTNIAAFGGDPAQVTLAGQSAGGFNACAILATPAHRGLFQRAIISSGGQLVHDLRTADAFAQVFVDHLGAASRLLTASIEELLDAQAKAFEQWPGFLPFRGVLAPSTQPTPIAAIRAGLARDVDMLIGWCRDETVSMFPAEDVIDPAYGPKPVSIDGAQLSRLIDLYAKRCPALSRAGAAWKATTAEAFGITSMRIADAQIASGGRVYRYRLDYAVLAGPYGDLCAHGIDVPMVFKQMDSRLAKLFGLSAVDAPMQDIVHDIWSSFVKTGAVDADIPPWPLYDSHKRRTMILDRSCHVAENLDSMEREIWEGIL
jgi:para-nitrobenzyl esterase